MKKFTKKDIKILRGFWKDVESAEDKYWNSIDFIEKQIKHAIGINVEIFHADGSAVGIGDYIREYELVQLERLTKEDK